MNAKYEQEKAKLSEMKYINQRQIMSGGEVYQSRDLANFKVWFC